MNKESNHLLDGIRVIDAASFIAGPTAATIMSDFGAEVIKIEPQSGDSLRNLIVNGMFVINTSALLIKSTNILWATSSLRLREILFLFLEVNSQQ